ncbi:MAG: hypothetical protein JJE44_13700 [Flavobacteriaceae bacterium]|nr:hypothetical protein [Flavobacteriaceae bacterium]
MTKEQNRLNISTLQFQRLKNIDHPERVLFDLHKAKEANKVKQAYHKYGIIIFKEKLKPAELTGNLILNFLAAKKSFTTRIL